MDHDCPDLGIHHVARHRRSTKHEEENVLKAKTTTEIQCIHVALYGRPWSRMLTMPVPMLTENHLTKGNQ